MIGGSRRLRGPVLVAILAAAPLAGGFLRAQRVAEQGAWLTWGGDNSFTRYSPLATITPGNVADLRVAWRWPSPDRELQTSNPLWRAGRNEETPLMVNGALYTITGLGLIAALDPATGETRWVHDPGSYRAGGAAAPTFVQRGLAYWTDGTAERVLAGTNDAYLVSIDAKTGRPDTRFGVGGKVDLLLALPGGNRATRQVAGRRPLVAGDVVIMGSAINDSAPNKEMPPGYVQAFDARTGKSRWIFHTVPRAGEVGFDTWEDGSAEYSGNSNVWAGMAYDPELDYVYLPTSTPTNDYYGGHRLGDNLFAESLVCVEAKTGKRVWHFQAVHHGLWDYDFPSTPVLGEITVDGKRIKVVMQASKQAFLYAFDRKTGKPVWPIEERPVPQSTVPGERTSPTQPFPTKPPAFDLQGTTEDTLMDFTPALRERALKQLKNFDHGPLFTPPSLKGTLTLPGIVGGANWPGGAFDPETGVFYVGSRMNPSILQVTPGGNRTNLRYRGGGGGPGQGDLGGQTVTRLADLMTVDGLPLFKPPYCRVTAIDMNKGERLWMAPLGNGPRNHPLLKDLTLPPLGGDFHRASVLVTKTLLFVTVSGLHSRGVPERAPWAPWADPADARNLLYAFDKTSGTLLHAFELDGLSAAAPMTYVHRGRQYLVVATGGGPTSELVALALGERTAQSPSKPAASSPDASLPRTRDGHPDLQGTWVNFDSTPLEAPSAADAARLAPLATWFPGIDGAQRAILGPNPAPEFADTAAQRTARRRSLVVDPADGRVPVRPDAEARRRFNLEHLTDSHEFHTSWERCITRGVPGGMFPAGYNNGYQIFQTRDHVAIVYEMIHEARIIPLDGRPHLNRQIPQWNGDSRGRWEGDTLVVEVTNYDRQNVGTVATGIATTATLKGIPQSENMRVVERFTRTDANTLRYQATIEDPAVYTRPWTVEMPLNRADDYRLYEYACHEGNYGLANTLSGARTEERTPARPDALR